MKKSEQCIIVRGAGDLATGVIYILHRLGYKTLALEVEKPTAIRRRVAFSDCVYHGNCMVENVSATRFSLNALDKALESTAVPVIIDPQAKSIDLLKPIVLIDAILAKKNLGTTKSMAPLVIALGPGFTAQHDCHLVIETMRGHNLGRIISEGSALPNTGVPGLVGGEDKSRVIHAPASGRLELIADIGSVVTKGQGIARIHTEKSSLVIEASISGVLRGILPNGFMVYQGLKMADIDPRISEQENCFTISDKARTLGMAVLTAMIAHKIYPPQ